MANPAFRLLGLKTNTKSHSKDNAAARRRLRRVALDKLRPVLEGENKEAIIKTTMAIKPDFAKLFIMFGDFAMIK